MDAKLGEYVDHLDHDTLDNRKGNLKAGTQRKNVLNRKGANRKSKSGIKNVNWNGRRKCWMVQFWNGDLDRNEVYGFFKENELDLAANLAEEIRKKKNIS